MHLFVSAIFILTFWSFFSVEAAQVLVRGAGPAGLAAAIAAKRSGYDVRVQEKRLLGISDFEALPHHENIIQPNPNSDLSRYSKNLWASRIRVVLLDESTFQTFQKFGVSTESLKRSKALDVVYGVFHRHQVTFENAGLNFAARHLYYDRQIAGTGRLREIELALLKRFLDLGGVIEFGASDEAPEGLKSDYTIIAEGAHSATSEALSMKRIPLGFKKVRWIVGTYELKHPVENAESVWSAQRVPESPFVTTALINQNRATIYASPTGDFPEASQVEHDQIIEKIAKQLGIEGTLLESQYFDVTPDRAEKFIQNGVILVGDNARKTDPSTGFGVSLSMADADRLSEFFKTVNHDSNLAEYKFMQAMEASVSKTIQQVRWSNFLRMLTTSFLGQLTFRTGLPLLSTAFRLAETDCKTELNSQSR